VPDFCDKPLILFDSVWPKTFVNDIMGPRRRSAELGWQPPATCARMVPLRSKFGTMPVNLSIKNAPDRVVQRLRERAERHHRSLQGELLAIIEAAVEEDRPAAPADILAEVRRLGLRTPSEAAALIRADRDGR